LDDDFQVFEEQEKIGFDVRVDQAQYHQGHVFLH
jgi:hypothetical protein